MRREDDHDENLDSRNGHWRRHNSRWTGCTTGVIGVRVLAVLFKLGTGYHDVHDYLNPHKAVHPTFVHSVMSRVGRLRCSTATEALDLCLSRTRWIGILLQGCLHCHAKGWQISSWHLSKLDPGRVVSRSLGLCIAHVQQLEHARRCATNAVYSNDGSADPDPITPTTLLPK